MSCTQLLGLSLGSETQGLAFSKPCDLGKVTTCLQGSISSSVKWMYKFYSTVPLSVYIEYLSKTMRSLAHFCLLRTSLPLGFHPLYHVTSGSNHDLLI